jgi:two-component system CheB/CheR fusion protein
MTTTEGTPDTNAAETTVEAPAPVVTTAEPGASEREANRFPIVGIGASAGGLAAFEAFLSGMPADVDPGMAFVLVQHLAPDHKSILTDLLQRYTRMQVFEVEDGMKVRRNCAYIIPPNRDMALLNGSLQLLEPFAPRGQRLPINFFFRSLAQDQRDRAIGIVLSGTGSDGTLGVRAIKGEGGMVMAQTPDSTEFDGMPRSALATGLVDFELPPAEMPAQLIAYVAHAFARGPRTPAAATPSAESALKKVLVLLRARTGHDFSLYKPSTVCRRVERRMAVHQIDTMDRYLKHLQRTPSEVDALFRDILIGVTSFFRDPEAFAAVAERAIPKLLDGRPPGAVVRVWSPGCSTGEEAYSLAILLAERQEATKKSFRVQVFATDIDAEAIATARAGRYPGTIAADVSSERLARFFAAEPDGSGYRIHKTIRDMVVFSEQSVIQDPPFSKLDIISCRNLLIYMGGELQKKLMPLFHYTLNPGGFLFLGTSETVGDADDLFAPVDRKLKLYVRRADTHRAQQHAAWGRFLPPGGGEDAALRRAVGKPALAAKVPLRELTEQALVQELGAAGVLVNDQGDILYIHGRTGMYLQPAAGEPSTNILKMAREGLRAELGAALHEAAEIHATVRRPNLRVRTNGDFSTVNLTVRPVRHAPDDAPLYLVLLEPPRPAAAEAEQEAAVRATADAALPSADVEARIEVLTRELRAQDEYLQSANEELETSNEELKSANEEMQSVNQELQSANEELETSKEELQSVNEELASVNVELQTKVADLSRANNDLNNLLSGTGIATVFVDYQLRILRFTPTACSIINLIQSDVGRPVSHLVCNLVGYDHLAADVTTVLDTLVSREVKVQTTAGRWFTMRIMPYRTLDHVIEGAVISFVDITEMEKTRDTLRRTNELLRSTVVARDAQDATAVHDLSGRVLVWNRGAARMFGWSEVEALAMNVRDRIPPELRQEESLRLAKLGRGEAVEPCRTRRLAKDGTVVEVWVISTALLDDSGQVYALATTERAVASSSA